MLFLRDSSRAVGELRYKHIPEDHDLGWSAISVDTRATYTRLGVVGGTFRVTDINNYGLGGKQERAAHIVIGRPFWAKWWF